MAKKKFSKEFKVETRLSGFIGFREDDDKTADTFCPRTFRRVFKMSKKQVPLDKPTKVRVDITILE